MRVDRQFKRSLYVPQMTERETLVWKNAEVCQSKFYHNTYRCIDEYSRVGRKMKIRLEKSALNNFKVYKWQKRKT